MKLTWTQWMQITAALVVLLACYWLGQAIWPVLKTMVPILAWTILIAVEIIVVSLAVGVPVGVVIVLRGYHKSNEVKVIEARKMPVNERGFIGGYVTSSPKDRILVPQLSAYSVEVPGSVHIEEDHSNSAHGGQGNDLAERRFAHQQWKDQVLLAAKTQPQITPTVALPEAPTFREIMPYIKDEQVVIACDHKGVVQGDVLDWLSTLIVGRPGHGKSTALYFFIAQLMMLVAKFQVLDPHGTLISLKKLLPYINRTDACIQSAPLIEQELEVRMDRYEANDGVCLDPHYMLVVDELPAIADREDQLMKAMDRKEKAAFRSLIDVIRRVVCEGRKYKMYCMVVGQSIPASILPTIARDNMSTRYVFYCSADHARMAGLDQTSIETYLPSLQGNVGKCIVAPSRMNSFLGAIPLTDIDDLRYVIESTGYVREGYEITEEANTDEIAVQRNNISTFPTYGNVGNDEQEAFSGNGNAEMPLPSGVTEWQLERIRGCYEVNWPLGEIARHVKLSGRNYWKFKAACAYLGIAQEQEA